MRKMIRCLGVMPMVWLMPILALVLMMSSCATLEDIDDEPTVDNGSVSSESENGEGDALNADETTQEKDDDGLNATNSDTGSSASSRLIQPPLPTFTFCPIVIAEEFLSQYISIFFGAYGDTLGIGLYNDEPVISANERDVFNDDGVWIGWYGYFTDGYGNVIYDVPFIRNLYDFGSIWSGGGVSPLFADRFRIFTIDGISEPLIIAIQYNAIEFSGGGYVFYEIIQNGNEFLPLGSMINYHHGGIGHDDVSLTPFINETGDILAYLLSDGGSFFALNNEGDFEGVASVQEIMRYEWRDTVSIMLVDEDGTRSFEAFTQKEFKELLSTGQAQTFFPNFPDGNFVPMVRMYDLEQELTERITERLRGTFPVVERSAPSP